MLGKFSLWKHFPEAEDSGSPEIFAEAHLQFKKKYNLDFIKFSPHQNNFVKLAEEPDMERNGLFQFYLETVKIIKANSDTPVLFTIFSPATVVKTLVGKENFKRLAESGRAFFEAEKVSRILEAVAEIMDGLGAGIFFANNVERISDYSKFLELDRKIISQAKFGIYHLHGHSNQAKLIIENSNLKFISWEDKRISLEDIGRKIPVGGIDRDYLLKGNFEKIESEITSLLAMKADSIIGPNCALRDETPQENLEMVTEIVRKF